MKVLGRGGGAGRLFTVLGFPPGRRMPLQLPASTAVLVHCVHPYRVLGIVVLITSLSVSAFSRMYKRLLAALGEDSRDGDARELTESVEVPASIYQKAW